MTLAPLRVSEAADSLAKASTPEPFSRSKTSNWVARRGGLPAYIQHVAHGIMRSGEADESRAIAKAIGVVKRWAAGGGNVDAGTRAAAQKAVGEWEALKASAGGKSKESYVPVGIDEMIVREAALRGIARAADRLGHEGLVALLAASTLREAAEWTPTLKRTAAAPGERERHQVMDGGQHVGTVACRPSMGSEGRWQAQAINGERVGEYNIASRSAAVEAIRKHLEEAPARVAPFRDKWMVSTPSSYSDDARHRAYPSEQVARYHAGLPAGATGPERDSQVQELGESVQFDLMTLSGVDVPALRRLQLARVTEVFHFDPSETRDFRGRWIGHSGSKLADLPEIHLDDLGDSVGPGRWGGGAQHATGEILTGRVKDTEHAHRKLHPDGSLGEYSKDREALHQEILSRLFQGKLAHPDHARAIFTAGGPASGKSRMIDRGFVDHPKDVVHVNPDVIKPMLPEYNELKAAGRADNSSLVHEEASHISKLAMAAALEHHHHVLVDTVGGGNEGKFAGKVEAAMAAGHRTSVHYTTIPTDEAVGRAQARAEREQARTGKLGRAVPEAYLRSAHREVSQRFGEIMKLPGVHVQVFDNSGEMKMIAEKRREADKIRIVDGRAYREFLAKAKASKHTSELEK